ncbi:MAG: hypothetical protein WBD31_07205 [Rubripirellula sp.]
MNHKLNIAALFCSAALLNGCVDRTPVSDPLEASFTPRELSPEEHAIKLALLHDIVDKTYLNENDLNQALKGKPASDYADILSYADTFSVHGELAIYDFVIRVQDPDNPKRLEEGDGFLSIGVTGDLITGVGYDVLCR